MSKGLVDLQLNGAFGVDFNGHWTDEDWIYINHSLADHGYQTALATVITDDFDRMCDRIKRLAKAISDSPTSPVIKGIHVEGPFLSDQVGYVGAHPAKQTRDAKLDTAKRLINSGGGHVKILTLAPERDSKGAVTQWLSERGVIVSAGHTNASLDEIDACIDNGMSMVTHFGNACPAVMPRHNNILNRLISRSVHLNFGLIADGHHIPNFLLNQWLKILPDEQTFIVSDSIMAGGMPAGEYTLGKQKVIKHVDASTWNSTGEHFMGSATLLNEMERHLVNELELSPKRAKTLCQDNPQRILGDPGN
ncbi:MAG: N-acetylglucosamine-6-phosphate deacetylase [Planctomycetota bacterium]